MSLTAFEQLKQHMADSSIDKIRGWLGRFGFSRSRAEILTGNLSGGEKTRLALAIIALKRPNLMILDEPTNHLDMDSRAALIEGLNNFTGAIVLISHDRMLIEATCDQLWLVDNGKVAQYFGDINDYQTLLLQTRKPGKKRDTSSENELKVNKKAARKEAAKNRAQTAPLKAAYKKAEQYLEQLTEEKLKLDTLLSNPDIYSDPSVDISALAKKQKEVDMLIKEAEQQWMDAMEKLEAIS
jgi:ATP-binding cassette subfamily F protein 3